MLKKLRTTVLALTLVTAISSPVFAEGNRNQNVNNTNTYQGNNYRTTAADNDTDWGWIGLLGLAGLFGLRGRNRNPEPDRR
jgi:MYXO-CTERM domain-containing protein